MAALVEKIIDPVIKPPSNNVFTAAHDFLPPSVLVG
jgi:hypothetical protein